VASACLAADGLDVVAVDADADLVAAVGAGRPPIHEPGLATLPGGLPRVTTDYAGLADRDVVVVAVDTVTDADNRSDLAMLDAHLERALPHLPGRAPLALMSQVPVGYTRALATRLAARRPELAGRLYHWVETLVIGDAVTRYRAPERIVLGGSADGFTAEPALEALVGRFRCPVFRMSYESAELTKAAINFYLATSVTFANTLADLCEVSGASMRAIEPALRGDRRIGAHAYLRPGLGIAGGNLERDLVHLDDLAAHHGVDAPLLRHVLEAGARRYGWLTRALERHVFARRPAPRLALWGLAYKKNTRSTRNGVAVRLLGDVAGRARVSVYDPEATLTDPPAGVETALTARAALEGAEALVIVTDWDEFARTDARTIRGMLAAPVVIDAVGVLDARAARAAGLTYVAVGEPV
jgi:UDPglucose 6-dehydrogenase